LGGKSENLSKTNFFILSLAALTLIYRALNGTGKFALIKPVLLIFIFVYLFYGLAYERILG
jgi:hypothetical protein